MNFSKTIQNELRAFAVAVTVVVAAYSTPIDCLADATVSDPSESSLNAALSVGGHITFTFDGTITLTTGKTISINTVLDATGHAVTISGGNSVQPFTVNNGVSLTLSNLTIANGRTSSYGGAVYNSGTVNAYYCSFLNNAASGTAGGNGANGQNNGNGTGSPGGNGTAGGSVGGGAICNLGTLSLINCNLGTNSAAGGNGGNGGAGGYGTGGSYFGGNGGNGAAGGTGWGGAIYNGSSPASAYLSGCTLTGNSALGGSGGSGGVGGADTAGTGGDGGSGSAGATCYGGAVYNGYNLTLNNCTFAANGATAGNGGSGGTNGSGAFLGKVGTGGAGATGAGAGVYNAQNLTLTGSTFNTNWVHGGNSAAGGSGSGSTGQTGPTGGAASGGGVYNGSWGIGTNCTFYHNSVTGGNGGNGGPGSGSLSTGGNGGNGGNGSGGAVCSSGTLTLVNCTLSTDGAYGGAGGQAGSGIFSGGSGSSGSAYGGNVANLSGTFTLKNSIVAYNLTGNNGYGTFTDSGNNISSDASVTVNSGGSTNNCDPKLSGLANNGGPTMTCALQSTSPAINKGADSWAQLTDQRGYLRSGTSDIGAYEYNGRQPPQVQVLALGPYASLDGAVGLFFISGTAGTNIGPITINYSLSGTASNGVDYVQLTNSVTIPTNWIDAVVSVRGISGAFTGTNKTVTLTLASSSTYQISTNNYGNVTVFEHANFDPTHRYVRGSSTAPDFQSFVIPLSLETGVPLDASGGNATTLFPNNKWTNTLYHLDATNINANLWIPFENPIVAFGSPVGGSPLYLSRNYSFGIYAGKPLYLTNALRIQVYYRSNSAYAGTISLPIPDSTNTNQLTQLVTNGFTQTFQGFGLQTVMLVPTWAMWGLWYSPGIVLTHSASTSATNYFYVVEQQGYAPYNYMVLNGSSQPDWSKLYAVEFSPYPPGRALFVDEPHFDGAPLPPEYFGKSVQELTNVSATLPDLSALVPSNYLTIDGSPELRRHPILDQFVLDMGKDPLALATYVINEIDLTDTLDYDTNYSSQPAVNLGGVDRSALATFQEGQGSPAEQCALLVYLLRQAGIPALYIYPTNGGLQMLDFQLSKLLRVQLRGAVSQFGQTNTLQLINVNYPWVAAYVGTNWVQVFPWLKDTEIIEGFNLYDYMPTNYNSGYKWLTHFIAGDTNIFSLSSSDQPLDLLPLFIQNNLNANYPGMSVDDLGVQLVNRRHAYAQWSDFPKPFSLFGAPMPVESLRTNLNLFNTVEVRVYSQTNPSKYIDTGELQLALVHNRKMLLKFQQIGTNNQHNMILSLAPYSTNVTSLSAFSTNADQTWKLVATNQLDSTDDYIIFEVVHRRLKFLPPNYVAPEFGTATNTWGYNYFEQGEVQAGCVYQFSDTFRKGDFLAFCLDVGRVSQRMLDVHAQEIWQFNQTANTNQPSTLDPDIYLGTTSYLMGMSYFNYYDRFNDLNCRLHKFQEISAYEHGFGLYRPLRDSNGNLVNGGQVNPVIPAVHMPDNGQAIVFNGTLKPGTGADYSSASLDWWLQAGVAGSAAEHAVLRSFYQTNAISSVKLLQQAGTNAIALNKDNYLGAGQVVYNGVALKNADATLWATVTNFFTDPDYDREAFVTPGVVTNGTFAGVGAILFSSSVFNSPVSGLNGGYAYQSPTSTFAQNNSPQITVQPAPSGAVTPYQLVTSSTPQAPIDGAPPEWSLATTGNNLSSGLVSLDPSLLLQTAQLQALSGNSVNAPAAYSADYNTGVADTTPSSNGDWTRRLLDPVDAVTGEFYVDATDLTLPGPMPLQIRRNYSSQNLAENQFGFGWKISYVPFLTIFTNSPLIYAAEMDGSFLSYRQSPTNNNLWLPLPQDNPTLNNHSSMGIGSVANLFNNRLTLSTATGTNVYTMTGADGSVRMFTQRAYSVGGYSRLRPYLDSWQDNKGNFYTFQYGTNSSMPDFGQVRRIQSSNGNFLGFYYDVYGHIIEAYSGDGRRLQYDYDTFGDLTTVTLPDESQISYVYQHSNSVSGGLTNVYSAHLIVQELKPEGRVLQNIYDSQRRVTNQSSTVGIDLSLVRNATFIFTNNFSLTNGAATITGTTTILDYLNRPTTYFYTNSLIRRIYDPLGGVLVQNWFESTETNAPAYPRSLKTVIDKRGLITSYLYDSQGNATNVTLTGDLLGDGNTNTTAISTALYTTNNLLAQIVDPAGNTNCFYYTNSWLLARQELWPSNASPAQAVTNMYFYVTVTNAGDGTVAYGLRSQEIRASYSSDAATNEFVFNSRGFPLQQIRFTCTADPAVTVTNLYNTRGELVAQTNAAGQVTTLAYHPLGQLAAREIYDTGASTPMSWGYSYYNQNGELTWTDGPRYNPEDYVWRDYDGAGRKTQEIRWRSQGNSDGSGVSAPTDGSLYATTFFSYDPFGNLTNTVDPVGNFSDKYYDALGRLIREEFYNSAGLLLSTNGMAYDTAGDVTNSFNALGGLTYKQYTATGKSEFQSNPDGSTNAWRYYPDGRLRREIQRNGAYWETTYDNANRKSTKVFYAANGAPLATNVTVLDRRGNPIQRIDAAFNIFTNLYDGLDRIKVAAGPSGTAQQITTYLYDASGTTLTTSNALGEQTVTTRDALGRVTSVQTYPSGSTSPVRATVTHYSADHNSYTVWQGGTNGFPTVHLTDTFGNDVLTLRYPTWPNANVIEFTLQNYDSDGNLVQRNQCSVDTNGLAVWSTNAWTYDGANRLSTEISRDGATIIYGRDALGNVTNRMMPGGIQWNATYNNAGHLLQEWNTGSGGAGTRTNTYIYYSSGPFAGLLQTNSDARGVSCYHAYDDWLRISAKGYAGAPMGDNLTTYLNYDARGYLTGVSDVGYGSGTYSVGRTYDPYGQLSTESVAVGQTSYWSTGLWDAAGRRSQIIFGSFYYNYTWRADGLLNSVSTRNGTASYAYDDAGILTNRTVGSRTTAISARDGTGRPLTIVNSVNSIPQATEQLLWTEDDLLASDTIGRSDYTNLCSFGYALSTRRLNSETLSLDATHRWTNSFAYDAGSVAGPGLLTSSGGQGALWTGGPDVFSRTGTETNTAVHRRAYGRLNGPATVSAALDSQPVDVTMVNVNNHDWPWQWQSELELTPGAHQLSVSALDVTGLFTTNSTSWFTNTAANESASCSYDGAGNVTQIVWKNSNGTTNRTQSLSYDVKGQLANVSEADTNGNGYFWTANYDTLGRRFQTTVEVVSNNMLLPTLSSTMSLYDPAAEFLELDVIVDGQANNWKLYGPDLNGNYGGMNGTGGLEAIIPDNSPTIPLLNDVRGNILGAITNGVFGWNSARPTGYGAVPGYRPVALSSGGNLVQSSAWRDHWPDVTGYVWLGKRYYDPVGGNFLSSDPLWNGQDPNYYSFCGGDPINHFDSDGRYGKQWVDVANTLGSSDSIGDRFLAMPAGFAGAIMSGIGAIPSVFSQASQGMADARAEINTYSGGDAFLARSLMLPANFAFGTTALVNDPVNSVAGMPQGFVNFGSKIGTDVYNVGANPSVNTVFDIGEDVLGVAGLSTGIARSLTATGVTAPLEDLSVRTYLQATKGDQWLSYYNSFAPGTAQLNVTLGGQTLFRAANSQGAAAFGEFASVEQPATPAQAIQGNALDPAITGNRAGQLFQVTTRPGFSISGTAAAQGLGYPGGFTQVFQVGRNSIPTWSSVQQISYSGGTP